MNEIDAGQDSAVGPVSNLSSEGQVGNSPHEIPRQSVSQVHSEQTPLAESGGDGTRSVPATDSGQVENLSHALDRIQSHPDLSRGMRQRLADAVQRQPPAEGPTQIPLDDVLAILTETVPGQLRLDAGELPTAPHPEGEAFFSGDPASDADRQATEVARQQLALSGLLRR